MLGKRILAACVLFCGIGIGYFVYFSHTHEWRPFRLGLDLSGGTSLMYRADVSSLPSGDVADSLAALRDTIERRVNAFGVAEPLVQTETGGTLAGSRENRLIVELPGVTDTQKAIDLIGETPLLEFRLLKTDAQGKTPDEHTTINDMYGPAIITGRHLTHTDLQFGGNGTLSNEPMVVLHFNAEGTKIFADATAANVGQTFGIFLDGAPITTPVIREAIPNGTAVISGNFTPESAKELVRNLNYGALPVPVELISTNTVGGTLGERAVHDGLYAGIIALSVVIAFMVLWYRAPGFFASLALGMYGAVMLALFLLVPVTLTAAGIAGFILSIGMAVDANILIFERMKEERRAGKQVKDAIHDGFARAWPSIRDSNISSMITAVILFWFGTSLIKGFALVFGLGVLVSMLTAISVSRTFLMALGISGTNAISRFLFSSGIK